jgi:hypothetical protein
VKEYSKPPSDAVVNGYDVISFINHHRKGEANGFKGLYADYRFVSTGLNENNHIYIYKYQNYELVEVK